LAYMSKSQGLTATQTRSLMIPKWSLGSQLAYWWEQVCNLPRPHQALQQHTPAEYLRAAGHEVPEVSVSRMY